MTKPQGYKKTYKPKTKGKGKRRAKNAKSQGTKVDARLTCVTNGLLTLGNGTTTTNYCLGYVSALGQIPGASGLNNFFNNPDFKAQLALYDEVCIKSFTMRYNPLVTQNTIYDQSQPAASKQVKLQPNVYTWIDRTATAMTAVNDQFVNKLGQYDSFKQHNVYKKFSRKVALKTVWLQAEDIGNSQIPVNQNTVMLTEAGLLAVLGIYGQNILWSNITEGNEPMAQLEVHWHFQFRGKKAVGINVDGNGVVTLTPMTRFAPLLPTLTITDSANDSGGVPRTTDPVTGDVIYVTP